MLFDPPFYRDDWTDAKLYDLAEWINGGVFRSDDLGDTGVPVIKIKELKQGITGATEYSNEANDDKYRVQHGDILFAWSGSPETSIGTYCWKGTDGWLNQHIFRVEPVDGIHKRWLFHLLRYLEPHFKRIATSKQTTGLGHVTQKDLRQMSVSVPTATEQRRIAFVLDSLTNSIHTNTELARRLESVCQYLFRCWFIDFTPVKSKRTGEGPTPEFSQRINQLFPDTFEQSEIGLIPKGWETAPLPERIEVNPRRRLQDGEVAPYVEMANLPIKEAVPSDWRLREYGHGRCFMNGDTLVARITPSLEHGKSAFVTILNEDEVGWGSTEYLVLRADDGLPLEFPYFLAQTSRFRSFAIANFTGTSGRQRVPHRAWKHFTFAFPPEEIAN